MPAPEPTPEEAAKAEAAEQYKARGQRLADLLGAHVAEQRGLVSTFAVGQVDSGPLEGMPEFIIVVARQVGYPPPSQTSSG